jgi:hypothetical protein
MGNAIEFSRAENMHADAAPVTVTSALRRGRTKRRGDVDGRSAEAKRIGRLMAQFCAELGGLDAVSPSQMVKIRRASELIVTAEHMRAASLRRERVDPLALVRLENLAARAVGALGLPAGKRHSEALQLRPRPYEPGAEDGAA